MRAHWERLLYRGVLAPSVTKLCLATVCVLILTLSSPIYGRTTRSVMRPMFFPFVSIGLAPQDLKYGGEPTSTEIGKRNHIREFVTIHRGTEAAAA